MAPNIIPPTTGNLTNSTASTFRIFTSCSAAARRTIWRSLFSAARSGPPWCLRPPISIPGSQATWCATSNGWGRRSTPPTGAPAPCTANNFCSTPSTRESTTSYIYGRLDFVENKVPASDFEIVVNLESWADQDAPPRRALRLDVAVEWRQDPKLEGQRSRRQASRLRLLTRPTIRSPSLCCATSNSSSLWSGCWPLPIDLRNGGV